MTTDTYYYIFCCFILLIQLTAYLDFDGNRLDTYKDLIKYGYGSENQEFMDVFLKDAVHKALNF